MAALVMNGSEPGGSYTRNAFSPIDTAYGCRFQPSNRLLYQHKQKLNNDGLISDTLVLEQYKNETNRLKSFTSDWPADTPVSKQELAQAGWFYTGHSDRVQCPWCQGAVHNWVKGDSGLGEHKRHFPSCPFVQQKLRSLELNEHNQCLRDVHKPKVSWMEMPSVKAVLDLGYSYSQVENIIGDLHERGIQRETISADLILDEIFALDHHCADIPRRTDENNDVTTNKTHQSGAKLDSETSRMCHSGLSPERTEKLTIEIGQLRDENEKLKTSMTCKVCLDAQVGDLFLPCRHLVCCVECSASVQHCPLCRERIAGTIKVFI